MKIALLQCNTVTGDIAGNARRILTAARRAEGAGLCVTPELALCGVSPRRLLFTEGFVEACDRALKSMARALAEGPAVLVGAPVANPVAGRRNVFNAAVLLQGGACSVVSRKVCYGSCDDADARYFEYGVSCGLMTLAGWRLGVILCQEDHERQAFWKIQHANAHNPLMELMSRGVDGIVHMGASSFAMRRQSLREHMYSHVAARHHVHLFSANLTGGNDGDVYAGQSLAFGPTGALLARGRAFEEDVVLVDTAADGGAQARPCACAEEECWRALVLGTRDFVRKSGAERALIGLSGGMDSALVAAVAVEALGPDKTTGLLMPSNHTSLESLEYASALARSLGIRSLTLPIAPVVDAFGAALEPALAALPPRRDDVTFENLQARVRGTLLMSVANREGSLVLNTGNKSEAAMGYCTLYGDTVGALAVIGDMTKTLVYRVARWYNKRFPNKAIPEEIIARPPTAELSPGQLDTDSLPPYDALDAALESILGGSESQEEENAETAALRELVAEGLRRSEFKRRQEPLALKVSGRPFGEHWELPVTGRYALPE